MEKAHHFEYATVGYDAMVAGRDGVMGHFIETVACWYVEKPFDVPVFDIRGPAPGNRGPICPKPGSTKPRRGSRPILARGAA